MEFNRDEILNFIKKEHNIVDSGEESDTEIESVTPIANRLLASSFKRARPNRDVVARPNAKKKSAEKTSSENLNGSNEIETDSSATIQESGKIGLKL